MAAPTQMTPAQAAQAVERLDAAIADGNADAAMLLGHWFLRGIEVPRDIPRARRYFERAGELGSIDGRRIAIGWLAGGTGCRPDWATAISRLGDLAATDADAQRQLELIEDMDLDNAGHPRGGFTKTSLSEHPLVELIPDFASPDECDYLISVAGPMLGAAPVGNPAMGGLGVSRVRTCDAMGFILILESPFIHALSRRIATASGTSPSQGEPTQIFRYSPGQEFKPHMDSSPDFANQRIASFLVYLNDSYEGGETRFLESGLTVKGKRGDALLFKNVDDSMQPDPASRHAGLAVASGTKWLLSRWIRQSPIQY